MALYNDGSNIHNWHLFFKANTKKESSSGGGGGTDGNDWWNFLFQPPNRKWLLYGGVAAAIAFLTTYNTNSGKEITWQEFRVKYLEQGEVSATTYLKVC